MQKGLPPKKRRGDGTGALVLSPPGSVLPSSHFEKSRVNVDDLHRRVFVVVVVVVVVVVITWKDLPNLHSPMGGHLMRIYSCRRS